MCVCLHVYVGCGCADACADDDGDTIADACVLAGAAADRWMCCLPARSHCTVSGHGDLQKKKEVEALKQKAAAVIDADKEIRLSCEIWCPLRLHPGFC